MSRISDEALRSIWWAYFWRTILIGGVIGGVVGLVVGVVLSLLGALNLVTLVAGALGIVVNAVVSYFVLRVALEKKYSGFSVRVGSYEASTFG